MAWRCNLPNDWISSRTIIHCSIIFKCKIFLLSASSFWSAYVPKLLTYLTMVHSPGSVDDGYFNNLARQPHSGSRGSDSPQDVGANGDEIEAPKTKRIACVICRRRKLKCDGNKPKCATCARLGHQCSYDEVRRKSGPKRGYVKDLEARLG